MSDIDDIARHDEHVGEALRDSLARLATGSNELLREMAIAVLNGDLTLRQALASTAYSDELAKPFSTFWTRYEQMTPEERDQLITHDDARRGIDRRPVIVDQTGRDAR